MSKFTLIASALATSALLAACGSGGGSGSNGGNPQITTTVISGPEVPPSQQTPVSFDTAIVSSMHIQSPSTGPIELGINCNRLVCRSSSGESVNLGAFTSENDKLQRNGRVNGPSTVSGEYSDGVTTANTNAYGYWMGDSAFGVINGIGFTSGNSFSAQYAAVTGNDTGSGPSGNANYTGKAVAITVDDDIEGYEIGGIEDGYFEMTYDFGLRQADVFVEFDTFDYSFDTATVNSDGSFKVNKSHEKLDGNFFGANHREVAGTFEIPEESVVGSFGGIKDN